MTFCDKCDLSIFSPSLHPTKIRVWTGANLIMEWGKNKMDSPSHEKNYIYPFHPHPFLNHNSKPSNQSLVGSSLLCLSCEAQLSLGTLFLKNSFPFFFFLRRFFGWPMIIYSPKEEEENWCNFWRTKLLTNYAISTDYSKLSGLSYSSTKLLPVQFFFYNWIRIGLYWSWCGWAGWI